MRVKLGDVCERGTSNLKLSDVSEKNGEFSVLVHQDILEV